MMKRYLILDFYYTTIIIKSNVPIANLKTALRDYNTQQKGRDYTLMKLKSFECPSFGPGSARYAFIAGHRLIGHLKAEGFAVGEIAIGQNSADEYTKAHFGNRDVSKVINIKNKKKYMDIYTNSTDQDPITIVLQRTDYDVWHREHSPNEDGKIEEIKSYVRGVLNRP